MPDLMHRTSTGRIPKKSASACSRCRQQKIKCSGDNPCLACKKRQVACKFDLKDQRVVVSRGYLMSLQRRAQQTAESPVSQTNQPTPSQPDDGDSHDYDETTDIQTEASPLTNQLSSGPSTFMVSDSGRTFYLGTSSNWSFTRRVVCMAYEAVNRAPMASTALQFDEETYDLQQDTHTTKSDSPNTYPAVPSRDHALHLVNTVQFHLGQLFHLYEEDTFMSNLNTFYNSTESKPPLTADPWFIQFLLIMAFGKALVSKSYSDKKAPGSHLFNRAMSLLPDMTLLTRDGAVGTEILCNVALYLHCFDHRMSAYNYIGQAMRLALSHGMHTDMPADLLGNAVVERCRRIWWTVFVLDCEMASLMGMPPSWQSGNMLCPLPDFPGNPQRKAALHMRIELSRQITTINATVYSADGRLNTTFLPRTKEALSMLARVSDRLHQTFPLPHNGGCGISRLAAHLHLMYHQCIVLATRPVLFCLFKMRLEPSNINSTFLKSTMGIVPSKLIQTCIESSQKTLIILDSLQHEGLLENFLVFDLESLASSTTSLILATFIEPNLVTNQTSWILKAWPIFDDMCSMGNLLAQMKKSELQQLNGLLDHVIESENAAASLCQLAPAPSFPRTRGSVNDTSNAGLDPSLTSIDSTNTRNMPMTNLGTLDNLELGVDFSSQQLLDMADSIDTNHVEWMAQTVTNYDIW